MSASASPRLGSPRLGIERSLGATLQLVFALACVFYAVLAFDYFISFANGHEGLWLQLLAALVSADYALGQGSVHVEQLLPYRDGLDFMLMHTTMGAIAMFIGPFQFMTKLRQRYPALHRTGGKVYLLAAALSMVAGIAYLATTPLDGVFSGAPFSIGLMGLDAMVLMTGWWAFAAIRRREIAAHQSWMAFNFGLLLATPVLRLLWVIFGWLLPGAPQTYTNLAITTFLLPLCVTGMLLWFAAQNKQRSLMRVAGPRCEGGSWRVIAQLGFMLTASLVALAYVGRFLLPTDPWSLWLERDLLSRQAQLFDSAWPLFSAYAALAILALRSGIKTVPGARDEGRCRWQFLLVTSALAIVGGLFGTLPADAVSGGEFIRYYWYGLAFLWLLNNARIVLAARADSPLVVRDWTVYSAALTWLPLSVIVQLPLWNSVAAMDNHEAALTAVILSFIGHYLIAHWLLYGGSFSTRRVAASAA